MAVYRESTAPWRKRLPLIIGATVVVLIVIVGAIVISNANRNKTADPKVALNSALDTLSQSIDLFDIEYAKIVAKTPASQTGAPGALQRARDTLNAAQTALRALNSSAFDRLQTDLNALNVGLSAAVSPDLSTSIADANQQIQTLRGGINAP